MPGVGEASDTNGKPNTQRTPLLRGLLQSFMMVVMPSHLKTSLIHPAEGFGDCRS